MKLVSQFEKFNSAQPASKISPLRKSAYEECLLLGIPSRKLENWKYTNISTLANIEWIPSNLNQPMPSAKIQGQIKNLIREQHCNIVFVNGIFNSTFSSELPSGVEWKQLHDFPNNDESNDLFEKLQKVYFKDRYFLKIKKEQAVSKPIHLIYVQDSEVLPDQLVQTHVTIELESHAKVTLLESFLGFGEKAYFSNMFANISMGEKSHLSYLRLQNESAQAFHIGQTQIEQFSGSQLQVLNLSLGGVLARHQFTVKMRGPQANSEVLGVYIGRKNQHHDSQTSIQHLVGDCTTSQLYKGLLDGKSRSVFNGQVYIAKGAQKAFSEQLNNNLLLSPNAEADSKPQLEIFADDVKATHGSTVGQLNAEELFYLLSRAIPRPQAIQLLSYGFVAEAIEKVMDTSLKAWATQFLKEAFAELESVQ